MGTFKGFFWEYHLYNHVTNDALKEPIVLRNYVDAANNNTGSIIVDTNDGYIIQMIENNELIGQAIDENKDGYVDRCNYSEKPYEPCTKHDDLHVTTSLTIMYSGMDIAMEYMITGQYENFVSAFNSIDDEYIHLFRDNGYISQTVLNELPEKYSSLIDKRIKSLSINIK